MFDVVCKRDSEWGRLICDFRELNRATVPHPSPVSGYLYGKVRELSRYHFKTGLDAYEGFNQLAASENASRLMQVLTARGVRQFTLLPFGVVNGPAYFTEDMLNIFDGKANNCLVIVGRRHATP